MPDFNIQHYWHCNSAKSWETNIGDYTVSWGPSLIGNADFDYACTCKGFQFRKTCKHIKEAEKIHCNWNQFVTGEDAETNGEQKCCPNCGEDVFSAPYAV